MANERTDDGGPLRSVGGAQFELEFKDEFDEGMLSGERWVDQYLPQWTTPERSEARYDFDNGLRLRIDVDQLAWREDEGPMRVSNIQTGTFSGPLGSRLGTHRHTEGLTVRTPVPVRRLWLPAGEGLVEATLQASHDPHCMLAIWLVGFEETSPADSGEICIAELFGQAMGHNASTVRLGVKAINDPRLHTDVVDLNVPFDARDSHSYGAAWNADEVHFLVDGQVVRTVQQGIAYPLQLMIGLFEFPVTTTRHGDVYPRTALVRAVRGYRRRAEKN